jgi:Sec-independent protein secretion pathway component TatC
MIGAQVCIFELPVASFLFSSIGLIDPKFLRQPIEEKQLLGTVILISNNYTP